MRTKSEPQILKEILKEIKDVKRRLLMVQNMIGEEELTEEELKQVRKARAEFKKGKYITLEQLKEELGIK